jgi:hypothetical protein
MMVGELLEILGSYPPDARVVVRDDQEPGEILELQPEHVVLRSVKRWLPGRTPKPALPSTSVLMGRRLPSAWVHKVKKPEGEFQMTVSELIEILGRFPGSAWVVQADDQAPGEIIEMQPGHVSACAVVYPHPDRAPKLLHSTETKVSVFIGPRMPPAWIPPKY